MGVRKELEELKREVYPDYWPFDGTILKKGLKQRIGDLEAQVARQDEIIQNLLDYFELEAVDVEPHVEIREQENE